VSPHEVEAVDRAHMHWQRFRVKLQYQMCSVASRPSDLTINTFNYVAALPGTFIARLLSKRSSANIVSSIEGWFS
jgi:hypothetical protein